MSANTFPPLDIPQTPLDEEHLARLIEGALSAAVTALAQVPFETHARAVTRPRPDGFETEELEGPVYGPGYMEGE